MEYCVIALNEASSSSCSNRFDLSSCDKHVWLLGKQYDPSSDSESLVEDVRSKLWITYRRNFPPIDENTRYTTDRGFGCMIRCGQMVLANALLWKNLGRDWRWSPRGLDANPEVYRRILKLFQDREDCHYSIHRIVQTGLDEGKSIGEWFGPNTIAQALKRISTSQFTANSKENQELLISIDAALDNVVVIDEIKTKFKHKLRSSSKNGSDCGRAGSVQSSAASPDSVEEHKEVWVPGILFIQLRLGLTKINPLYFAALKKTFQFSNSLGIIGGRPNHALYFIGHTEDDIIYLDPHSTQQYIDLDIIGRDDEINGRGERQHQKNNQQHPQQPQHQSQPQQHQAYLDESTNQSTPDSTYHCPNPEKMPLDRLDPSLALCFYFGAEKEFDDWCSMSQELLIKSEQAPMFEITKSRPTDWNLPLTSKTVTSGSGNCLDYSCLDESDGITKGPTSNHSNSLEQDEEFEMLA